MSVSETAFIDSTDALLNILKNSLILFYYVLSKSVLHQEVDLVMVCVVGKCEVGFMRVNELTPCGQCSFQLHAPVWLYS